MKRVLTTVFTLALTLCFALVAHGQSFNATQTDSGLSVSATSTYSNRFSPEYAVNGDTTGHIYNDGTGVPGTDRPTRGFWNNGNSERFGTSSLTLSFGRPLGYLLTRVEVVSARNDFNTEREPSPAEEGLYAIEDFDIHISRNGVDYSLACVVRGNKKVIRGCDIDPFNTVRHLRVVALKSVDGFYRVAEVRALAKQ